jgi:hypothetical protein
LFPIEGRGKSSAENLRAIR